ncbi:MAG: VWA domain-containing protein [Micavibrio sp.]|nr:MAG: VWA domain-containing protein [Micavibrio sp.]
MTGIIKWNDILSYIEEKVRLYMLCTSATIAVAFAVMAPVVVGSAGMALDFAQAYLVQQRLAQALDAAALAAAASATNQAGIQQKVNDFFDANYPDEKLGVTFEPIVNVVGDEITVTGNAYYNTFFLAVIGIEEIDVAAETVVVREVQGLEVVMVLDNTGSMSSNNNIQALRDAASSFVDILFDRTSDPDFVKIGMVPYSSSVNVGKYGLGQNPDGSVYGDGTSFVDLPPGTVHTTNEWTKNPEEWLGCVLAYNESGYSDASTSNDPYPNDTLDDHEGPWEPYKYERYGQDWHFAHNHYHNTSGQHGNYKYPNYNCPRTTIVPMTSDEDKLLDSIETMQAQGYTLGNYGMTWGWRVLSPEKPFEEGEGWNDPLWRKAIVMMTDGVNTMENTYTAYWRTRNHDINPTIQNNRFAETCELLKDEGVIIYTVTFAGGVNENTKDYYRDCATSEDQYFDAPSQDDLIDVFETISRELSNLHIKS